MLFYTHLAFSALIGLFLLDYLPFSNKLIFFLFLLLFSSLPDIDRSNSKFGKKVGFLSKIINFFAGHRNFFHSLLFLVLFYLLISIFSDMIAVAFLIAVSSHLVLDALTPMGVAFLFPLNYRVKGVLKTGSMAEKALFLIFITLIIIKLSTGHPLF